MDPDLDRGEDDIDLSPESIEELRTQRKSERKENAEEKRLENLERIKAVNSKTGIDPVELFPKEIWKMMCELVSPDDRWNLCKVHPMFSGLMESTMISEILLPKVLHLEKFIDAIKVTTSTRPRRPTSKPTLLNLRGVCKSLRDTVDNMLQDRLIKTIREDIENETDVLSVSFSLDGIPKNDSKQLDRLDDILLAAKDTPNMKFFLKSFSVELGNNYPDFKEFEEVSQKILSLVEIVGDQILYFNYYCHIVYFDGTDEFPCEECYILLQKCVSLMPNLKWLKVRETGKKFHKNEKEDAALRAALNCHLFPRLEHLEKISFEFFSCDDGEDVIYMSMLEANPHVRILTALSSYYYDDSPDHDDGGRGRGDFDPTQSFHPLDLTALAISNDTKYNGRAGENSFVLVRGMMNTNWQQLTNLRLNVDMFYASINELFRFVENFPTLENLYLLTRFMEITDELTPLRLPNLLKFEIVFEEADIEMEETADLHSFFSLEFLVGCKKLKSLAWIYSWDYWNRNAHQFWNLLYKGDAPNRFRIGLLNCWREGRDLQEADIWTLFPCLEYIKVGSPKQAGQWDKHIIECKKGKF